MASASEGRLGAEEIRMLPGESGSGDAWHCHDLDFQWFLVLEGWITLGYDDGEVTLPAGASCCQPPFLFHTQKFSENYRCLEVTAPAHFGTIEGLGTPLPARAATLDQARRSVITHDQADAWTADTPFDHRDLGARELSDRRLDLTMYRARATANGGAAAEALRVSRWMTVISGEIELSDDDGTAVSLGKGDSMTIPAGRRRTVSSWTRDCLYLELRIPAAD